MIKSLLNPIDESERSRWWPFWLVLLLGSVIEIMWAAVNYPGLITLGLILGIPSAIGFCCTFFVRTTQKQREQWRLADEECERQTRWYYARRNQWANDYRSTHGRWPDGGWPHEQQRLASPQITSNHRTCYQQYGNRQRNLPISVLKY